MRLNKKAVSVIVAYVILVTIVISLSGLVYYWLKHYISPGEELKCPDKIALIIKDYNCSNTELSITIQNKGFFAIDGFILRVSNRPDAEIGDKSLSQDPLTGKPGETMITGTGFPNGLEPGNEFNKIYTNPHGTLTFIEIQPFILEKKGLKTQTVYCENIIKQKLVCT